jgi:LuxR family transcriptional regulator, maltose regulon positive regulatory protein
VAWLSLDEGDSDPARFLTYFITALQTIAPTIGAGLLAVLQSPQPPPAESILTALLNDITSIPNHFVLVLDDYHRIDAQPVDQALTFLLDHLPPQMHLVITTRADPQLPLARLRVRDQMTELRASDLRFTPAEVGAFLEQVMGLSLSAAHIAALEVRTEGRIAGLQLAALSMQGHHDLPGFIRAFAGNHRYILDYLVEEVLQRQPEHLRSFLLRTSILERMNGPLCDAVTDQHGGSARLEALHRDNFFVVPLDDTRQWYRYITTCLPRFSRRMCGPISPSWYPRCTSAPARGTSSMARRPMPQVLTLLTHSLALAEPEGYIRLFVDEGEPMQLQIQAQICISVLRS